MLIFRDDFDPNFFALYPNVVPARQTQARVSMDEELDRVGSQAQSLSQNDLGYWEATFDDGIVMIFVPSGTFTMGSDVLPESGPTHEVTLSHYWIAKTPLTIGQFRHFIEQTGYVTNVELDGHMGPWVYDFDAQGFLAKPGYHWDNAFKDVTAKFPEITVTDEHPVNNGHTEKVTHRVLKRVFGQPRQLVFQALASTFLAGDRNDD